MLPATDTLLPVGQVLKSYGTEGEIFIRFFNDFEDFFENKEPVFLFYDGLPVPFSISAFTRKGNNRAIVKFAEIDSLPEAEEISGRQIFAPAAALPACDKISPEHFIGFELRDIDDKKIGIIGKIYNFSGNICFELEESKTLIPYNEKLLISSDEKKKIIRIEISQGLL